MRKLFYIGPKMINFEVNVYFYENLHGSENPVGLHTFYVKALNHKHAITTQRDNVKIMDEFRKEAMRNEKVNYYLFHCKQYHGVPDLDRDEIIVFDSETRKI